MVEINMRVRGGTRGGLEQFKWDGIKEEQFKDREQYLGISTKIGMMGKQGRWMKHDWWQGSREKTTKITEEKEAVKEYEDILMQEALGLRPKKLLLAKKAMSTDDLKEFIKKQKGIDQEYEDADKDGNAVREGARVVTGMGFAPHRTAQLEKLKADTLGAQGKLEGALDLEDGDEAIVKKKPKEEPESEGEGEGGAGQAWLRQMQAKEAAMGVKEEADEEKKEKKGRKETKKEKKEKKEKKKEKKEKKKEKKRRKKEKKRKKREASSSSSSSDSDN